MDGQKLIRKARRGNEQAQEALNMANYSRRLSPNMKAIALETALELFDEFSDESESGSVAVAPALALEQAA